MKLTRDLTTLLTMLMTTTCLSRDARCSEPQELTVAENGFAATYYMAAEKEKPLGVVVLGGSEGGQSVRRAEAIAAKGYPVLSLAFFKEPGLPDYLDELPLEYFDEPLNWFADRPDMQGRQIVLFGGSKGAELALLLASRKEQIAGVIAIAPSNVVWQGIPRIFWPPRSSWTAQGEPLDFVPYDASRGVDTDNLRPLYELSLTHADKVAQARIPVEQIHGPVLLLSGKADGMWPSAEMAESIVERLEQSDFPHAVEHVAYEDAGHTLNEHFMIGGTTAGNQQARVDSWQRILAFLAENFD